MADDIKKAGGISFGVSMTTLKLKKDIELARKSIGGFVNNSLKSLRRLTSFFGVGGVIGVGSLAFGINQSIKRIDALNESAKTLGITTESLSRLGFAASQSESSQESLIRGFARVGRSTDDAMRGVKEMSDLYKSLGLNASELSRLAPDQQFLKIGDAIRGLNNEQAQLVATQRIFGRGASDLVNVLRLTRDELAKLTAEADKFGVTIDKAGAEKADKARDAVNRLSAAWEGAKNELAIGTSPALSGAADVVSSTLGFLNKLPGKITEGEKKYGVLGNYFRNYVAPSNREFLGKGVGLSKFDIYRNPMGSTDFSRFMPSFTTPKQILEGLGGSQASAQRRAFSAELSRLAGGGGIAGASKSGGVLGVGAEIAKGFIQSMSTNATQIFSGVKNSPIAQLQRSLIGADLQRMMTQPKRQFTEAGTFSAQESGSLAAYQQRIRGMQQFDKVEMKQLKEAEKQTGWLETIAGKLPEFSNMGNG